MNWLLKVEIYEHDAHYNNMITVYREIFAPFYFCPVHPGCKRANLRLGELQWNVSDYLSLNTTMTGEFKIARAELFARVEGRKITRGEKTLFTVLLIYIVFTGKIYMCWLALVTLCFTYNVSVIPLRGIFPYQTPRNVTYWLICDYISDLVYLLDILVFKPRLTFLNSGLLEVCSFSAKLNSMFIAYSLVIRLEDF